MNEETNYVIQRMATERSITSGQMQGIIEEAIHTRATSSNPTLRGEMQSRFGSKEPSAEEFIEEIAKMIDMAHLED